MYADQHQPRNRDWRCSGSIQWISIVSMRRIGSIYLPAHFLDGNYDDVRGLNKILILLTVRYASSNLHGGSESDRTKRTMRCQSNIISLCHRCYPIKFAYSTTMAYLIEILSLHIYSRVGFLGTYIRLGDVNRSPLEIRPKI